MSRKTTIEIEFDPKTFSEIAKRAGEYRLSIKDYLIWCALSKEDPIIQDVEWNFDNWPKGQTYEGNGNYKYIGTRTRKVSFVPKITNPSQRPLDG